LSLGILSRPALEKSSRGKSSDAAEKASMERDLENHRFSQFPWGNGCFMAMAVMAAALLAGDQADLFSLNGSR
jgi:hypothetical protein